MTPALSNALAAAIVGAFVAILRFLLPWTYPVLQNMLFSAIVLIVPVYTFIHKKKRKSAGKDELKGIAGWLQLFIFLNATGCARLLVDNLYSIPWLFTLSSGLVEVRVFYYASIPGNIVFALFGFYCLYSLALVRSKAITLVIRLLGLQAILVLLNHTCFYLPPTAFIHMPLPLLPYSAFIQAALFIGIVLAWFIYFKKSRRVRNTWQQDGEPAR